MLLSTNCHVSIPIKTDSERCGTSSRARWKGIRGRPGMARAQVASASVSTDSIKGLAQSIAKPAYLRLLTAEPALRRAVPALIIAFLLTICVGAVVQVLDHRRQAIGEIVKQIEGSADFLVDGIERLERSKTEKSGFERRLQAELQRLR